MEAYRETRALDRPAALVRAAFEEDARFTADTDIDAGAGSTDAATSRWVARRGPYRTTAELDATTGELQVNVALPDEYAPGAVVLLVAVAAALALGAPAWTFLPALWGGAVLTLLPVGQLLVGPLPDTPGARTVDRGLTATTLAPYAATALALFGTLRGTLSPLLAAAPVTVLTAIGAGAYLLAGTDRRVTALDVPLSGLLAPLVAATNLLVGGALLRDARSPTLAVGLAGALALVLAALFVAYCHLALRRFRAARLAPVARRYRALAAAGYGALTLVLAGSVGLGSLAVVTGRPVPVVPSRAALRTALGGDPAVAGFTLLLVAPLAFLAVGWGAHLAGSVGGRLAAFARSEPLDAAARDTGDGVPDAFPVPVRVVSTDQPLVRPVAVAGLWRGVLVGRPVVETLAADELRAVVAHEAHHLDGRDLTAAAAAALAGLGFGGRNALLAFYDYAAAEQAADEHAARAVGPDATVRALRRLEALQARGAGAAVADGSGRIAPSTSRVRAVRSVLRAPYDLFFGRVLLDAAHRPVDERVRHLREEC
ncbi:M48 family metalloprotease [Haloglomus halophilum]|uniref:M48 family metalloprotease n=1 Tax=Haloglomus halophilum TaxID=2962672 RepID=UPI0020C9DC10|nr:M48 family metalloprotease [Haloglomus halophilum]